MNEYRLAVVVGAIGSAVVISVTGCSKQSTAPAQPVATESPDRVELKNSDSSKDAILINTEAGKKATAAAGIATEVPKVEMPMIEPPMPSIGAPTIEPPVPSVGVPTVVPPEIPELK